MKRPGPLPRRARELKRAKLDSKPGSGLSRSSRIARHTPVKRRNAKRRQSEFARCYGSKERVAWVKSLPCYACYVIYPPAGMATAGKCENAHTVTAGMGMKAGYETIVPLCRNHHRRYDEHRAPFDTPEAREIAQRWAAETERRWQAHINRDAA